MLLLDTSMAVPAVVQKSRADGMVKGQSLGQGLFMDLIPQSATVERGNTIVTSALGGKFPSGLLIGYVQTVYKEANAVFQKADVLPAVDFYRLERGMVITSFAAGE
jgi:rod shape-determining protein MreC